MKQDIARKGDGTMFRFRSFSQKALGASHKKENLPCQDAVLNYHDDSMAVAVVADGHGSPQYFRSNIGSQIAAQAAMDGICFFIRQISEGSLKEWNSEWLPRLVKNVVATWYEGIDCHEKSHPLAEDVRMETIGERYRTRYLNDPERQYFSHAYGTTLIAVAITDQYWFGFHIGDGKCEVLFDDGSWEQPIPWDDDCFLNSTTSICDDNAVQKFRFWHGPTEKDARRPAALFINSDGVDDSYPVNENEKYLKYLYRAVVLTFAKEGFESTCRQISELVEKFATAGSCDDISIAGIIDEEMSTDLLKALKEQDAADKLREQAAKARKQAEEKKQKLQMNRTKAQQAARKKDALQKKAQAAERGLMDKEAQLVERRSFIKRVISSAREERDQAQKAYTKAQIELASADQEYENLERLTQITAEEYTAAEELARCAEQKVLALHDTRTDGPPDALHTMTPPADSNDMVAEWEVRTFAIENIPALLLGPSSTCVYWFLHSEDGQKEDSEEFGKIAAAHGWQTLAVDIPLCGLGMDSQATYPDIVVSELRKVYKYLSENWQQIAVRADGLNAWHIIMALRDKPLEQCLFVSPILDVQNAIDYLARSNSAQTGPVLPNELLAKKYQIYAGQNPLSEWMVPTEILCTAEDIDMTQVFDGWKHFRLTVEWNCDRVFAKPEELKLLRAWEQRVISSLDS